MNVGPSIRKVGVAALAAAVLTFGTMSGQAHAGPNGVKAQGVETPGYELVARNVKRRRIIGTWRVNQQNGKWMIINFNSKGTFAIIRSDSPKLIFAGDWRKNGQSIRLTFMAVCTRDKKCNFLPASKRTNAVIVIRAVKGRRLITSEGTLNKVA